MKEIKRLAVLGGDRRQIFMTRELSRQGYSVRVWGLGLCQGEVGNAYVCNTWEEAIEGTEAVVLPLPISSDGVRINTPLHSDEASLRIDTLMDQMEGRLLLGGRISETVQGLARREGVQYVDYYESELLQQKNALPTAEGAIFVAMQTLPITIDGATVAVLGYGRIGSLLAAKLAALGADVTVLARRQEALTAAELCHHRTIRIRQEPNGAAIPSLPKDCRMIFNTVPQRLIPNHALSIIPKDCLYVDLASAPGGIDHTAAATVGVRSVWATALPGKYAPETAGVILGEVIDAVLQDA